MEMPNLRPTSISPLQKCKAGKDHLLVDRLTELPDEILVKILCLLTMKEAALTSILSRRWIHLWKYTTCLEFDMMHKLRESWRFGTLQYQRRCLDINDVIDRLGQHQIGKRTSWAIIMQKQFNYVKWVNRILDSHKSPNIYKFRAHFNLNVTFKNGIDRWVNFAIGKRVQILDLDLENRAADGNSYLFPIKILDHPNISLLRSLRLNCVDLTNQVLDILVLKIPGMESLCVSNTRSLTDTYVFSANPNLKHLEISKCENLKILRINASDLKSLTFYGPASSSLRLENTPNLVNISFGGTLCLNKFPKELKTDHFCHRLQSLTLKIPVFSHGHFLNIPILWNLKQLELLQFASDESGILNCSSLILACPALYKFILGIDWSDRVEKDREIERRKCLLPKSLKEVELHKFRGGSTDVEMAYFLFENAQSLEKICIDTRYPTTMDDHDLEAMKCGMQLATKLCPNAQVQVI